MLASNGLRFIITAMPINISYDNEDFIIVSSREDKILFDQGLDATEDQWPVFLQDTINEETDFDLTESIPDTQFTVLNSADEIVLVVESVPIFCQSFDEIFLKDKGWDWAKVQSLQPVKPNALCALSISKVKKFTKPYGSLGLICLKELARSMKLENLIAPVRPGSYEKYDGKFEDFLKTHNDRWIQTHLDIGGVVITPCLESQVRHVKFDKYADYILNLKPSGALSPIVMDQNGQLVYIEPNVWMKHKV